MKKRQIFNPGKKIKQPANAPVSIVNQQIDVRPIHRREQTVPSWKQAMQSAENRVPRRTLLYDLYHDTVLDDQVIAVWGKVQDAVCGADWQFVDKDGEPVDEINDIIDSLGFDDLLEGIIDSKGWGYSMFEPKFFKNSSDKWEMTANMIPRLNMRPEIGVVAYNTTGDEGINIRTGIYQKTVMEVGKLSDLGKFLCASLYAILKRGGTSDLAMFVQVFGTPIIDATWNGYDLKQRLDLLNSIKDLGAGGALVRPEGTNINLVEKRNNGQEPHIKFLERMDKAISKALLGTTETTESSNSSGFAQSKTHENQDNERHKRNLAFVRKTLNSRFLKVLEAHGFDTQGGKFIIQGEAEHVSKKDEFDIVCGLKEKFNLPMDDDDLYERFNIPKPKDYDQQKKAAIAPKKENPEPAGEPTKNKAPDKEVELTWWQKTLQKLVFRNAPAETTGATTTECCGSHHIIKLAAEDVFEADGLINRIYKAEGTLSFDFGVFNHTTKVLLNSFKKGFKKEVVKLAHNIGFQYEIDDPALLTAFEQNIFRFAGAKTLALTAELNQLFRESKSFEEFYMRAASKTEVYNRMWLETEYNTALLTGEAAATYHRLIKQTEIFPYWEYKVVGDDRVRPEHRLLDGIILPASDPRWKKLFPPNGWNCRCYIVPRMAHEFDRSQLKAMQQRADAYLSSNKFQKEEAQGWGVNRGAIGEIFTANQQYINKHRNTAFKDLNRLGAADYGLQSFSNAKKAGTVNFPVYNDTAETFFKNLEVFENKSVVRDYNNRPLALLPKNYAAHTTGKKESRVPFLKAMEEAVKQPDEVWMNGNKLEDIIYIKYYKDKAIVVVGNVQKSLTSEVSTWFPLSEVKKVINKFRRGLLIYSKK